MKKRKLKEILKNLRVALQDAAEARNRNAVEVIQQKELIKNLNVSLQDAVDRRNHIHKQINTSLAQIDRLQDEGWLMLAMIHTRTSNPIDAINKMQQKYAVKISDDVITASQKVNEDIKSWKVSLAGKKRVDLESNPQEMK